MLKDPERVEAKTWDSEIHSTQKVFTRSMNVAVPQSQPPHDEGDDHEISSREIFSTNQPFHPHDPYWYLDQETNTAWVSHIGEDSFDMQNIDKSIVTGKKIMRLCSVS